MTCYWRLFECGGGLSSTGGLSSVSPSGSNIDAICHAVAILLVTALSGRYLHSLRKCWSARPACLQRGHDLACVPGFPEGFGGRLRGFLLKLDLLKAASALCTCLHNGIMRNDGAVIDYLTEH